MKKYSPNFWMWVLQERAGVTTQKEFVNVKRIIVISKVSDVSMEPKVEWEEVEVSPTFECAAQ